MGLIIAWVLKHETLAVWGAIIVAAISAALLIRHDSHVIEAQRHEIRAAAATAQVQNTVQSAADTAQSRADIFIHQAQEATDAIQHAPGAETPVPDAVLNAWATGVDGLRGVHATPERQSSSKP